MGIILRLGFHHLLHDGLAGIRSYAVGGQCQVVQCAYLRDGHVLVETAVPHPFASDEEEVTVRGAVGCAAGQFHVEHGGLCRVGSNAEGNRRFVPADVVVIAVLQPHLVLVAHKHPLHTVDHLLQFGIGIGGLLHTVAHIEFTVHCGIVRVAVLVEVDVVVGFGSSVGEFGRGGGTKAQGIVG